MAHDGFFPDIYGSMFTQNLRVGQWVRISTYPLSSLTFSRDPFFETSGTGSGAPFWGFTFTALIASQNPFSFFNSGGFVGGKKLKILTKDSPDFTSLEDFSVSFDGFASGVFNRLLLTEFELFLLDVLGDMFLIDTIQNNNHKSDISEIQITSFITLMKYFNRWQLRHCVILTL